MHFSLHGFQKALNAIRAELGAFEVFDECERIFIGKPLVVWAVARQRVICVSQSYHSGQKGDSVALQSPRVAFPINSLVMA